MTRKTYAGPKQWPLEAVRVTLRHGRAHEQRERLLEMSARCPVHRTLINELKIRSELI